MPVQKIPQEVQQRLNSLPAPLLNTLFDLAQFHSFTPGDDMSKHIQGARYAASNSSEPGTASLYTDHANAMQNLQNYLYGNKAYDASGGSIFNPPPDFKQGQ